MSVVLLPTYTADLHRRNSASFQFHIKTCAAVVVEGATRYIHAKGATTTLALGLLLNTVGIGLFCWLVFTLAVFALPFFVAVSAGMMAFHSDAGIFGAPLVGIAAGAVTLAIGQTAFAVTRSWRATAHFPIWLFKRNGTLYGKCAVLRRLRRIGR